MGEAIRRWLHFPSVESFFSLRGFLVSFAALLLIVGMVRLATWLARRIFSRFSGPKGEDTAGMAGIQFYRRLLRLLAEYGLDRPPAETLWNSPGGPRSFSPDTVRAPRPSPMCRPWLSTRSTRSASASIRSGKTTSTASAPGSTPSRRTCVPRRPEKQAGNIFPTQVVITWHPGSRMGETAKYSRPIRERTGPQGTLRSVPRARGESTRST